jgi:hypothetical protein
VTLDSLQDYRYFTELYILVYKPEDDINVPKLFRDVQKKEKFVKLATTLVKNNRSADEIQRDKEEYFHYSHSEKEAIAKKLTIVAELSEGLVADKRLWRWIGEATASVALCH